jgi:hypothetical protein
MAWQYDRSELQSRLEKAQYDRSELQRRLEKARKQLDDIKEANDGRVNTYLLRKSQVKARRFEVGYLEDCLQQLCDLEKMMWFGTMPIYFRCGHSYYTLRFDEYDFETGPNFWSIEAEPPHYRRTHDCVCCLGCSHEIRDLHLQYRAYRHLDLGALLPGLIPDLHHIIRSYLVPAEYIREKA